MLMLGVGHSGAPALSLLLYAGCLAQAGGAPQDTLQNKSWGLLNAATGTSEMRASQRLYSPVGQSRYCAAAWELPLEAG